MKFESEAFIRNSERCEKTRGNALDMITFPWQERLKDWSINFLPGQPGLLGGTWTYERKIEVYVREYQSTHDVAFTLAHELGHAVDCELLSEMNRHQWRRFRGIDPWVPWWVESGATDFSSGSGDWAEAFAVWQVGGQSHSRVAQQPSETDLRLVARLAGCSEEPFELERRRKQIADSQVLKRLWKYQPNFSEKLQ